MEFAEKSLAQEIQVRSSQTPKKYFSNNEIYNLMKNLISGFALLEENLLVHGNIKPSNILIHQN